jgi:hypothetical protein
MFNSIIFKRLFHSVFMTFIFFMLQHFDKTLIKWYFYIMFFVLDFSLINSKFYNDVILSWGKKQDKRLSKIIKLGLISSYY